MKKILIISPFFIPFAGVGTARVESLVQYLLDKHNYEITILQNSIISYGKNVLADKKIAKEIKSIEVDDNHNFIRNASNYKSVINKLDLNKDFDVTIITVGPFYTLPLVSYIKKKNHHMPIILDMRDLWAHEPIINYDYKFKDKIKNFIKDYFYERKAIKKADKLVMMGNDELEYLRKFYSSEIGNKGVVIRNGFDSYSINFDEINKQNLLVHKNHTIGVFGKFSTYFSDKQLEELGACLSCCNNIKDFEFVQIGSKELELSQTLKKYNVKYENTGYMEYDKGLSYIKNNVSVCLISTDLNIGFGTKVFDYILCNKPIIFIGNKKSSLAGLLKDFKNAFICEKINELPQIVKYIFENNIFNLDDNIDVSAYSRDAQNVRFEEIIDKLINKGIK